MSETLFSQRQRCKTCRRALGRDRSEPVFHGLFCSTLFAVLDVLGARPGVAIRGGR